MKIRRIRTKNYAMSFTALFIHIEDCLAKVIEDQRLQSL